MPLDPTSRPDPDHVDRRPVLKVIAGSAVALTAVGAGARAFLHSDGSPDGGSGDPSADGQDGGDDGGPGLTLSAESGDDVASLYIGLGDDLLPSTGARRWESERLPTSVHSMVAFTWTKPTTRSGAVPHVQVRSRIGGRWSDWQRMPLLHDVPDRDEATTVTGTDAVWIGRSDAIQVRVRGARPDDLRLLLMQPGAHARDRYSPRPAQRRAAGVVVVRPEILDRVAWGADESWRSGTPQLISTIQQVHVHHTVSTNTYAPEDVPALIRGMYRYHTKTLGWSDIAYNFLVDRFGRIWTGRAGGASKPVKGAHTLGFNASSAGVSVIGNLDQVAPTNETLDAVAAVAAWKLNLYGRDPLGTTAVVSQGSDKYRSGQTVTLPVIDGHRDTNDTSCPGGYLYAAVPDIRNRAKARIDAATAASAAPVAVVSPASVSGTPELGQTLSVVPGAYDPADAVATYTWQRDGAAVATGTSYVVTAADVGHQLGVVVGLTAPLRGPGAETVTAAARVTAKPTVKLTATPKRKRIVVHVRVSPPAGVAEVASGTVVVQLDGRKRTILLRNGHGSTRFMHVKDGPHDVKAVFAGSGVLTRRVAKARTVVGPAG